MIANNIDIKVITDYTAFTNAVCFQVAVPVSSTDATTIYKDLGDGDWSQAEKDITAAVKKAAPTQIIALVKTLLEAYSGTSSSDADATPDAGQDQNPEPNQDGTG